MRTLFFLIFMAITIGGWIIQFINSQNHPPPPQRRRRENEGKDRVQSEIEQFLEEARRTRQGRAAPANQGGVEVVEPAPRRPPVERPDREQVWREQSQNRGQQKSPAERSRPKKEQKSVRGKQQPAKGAPPPQPPATAASSVVRHVQEHLAPRIGQLPPRDLPHAVDANVSTHLGQFKAESEESLGAQSYRQTKVRQSTAALELRNLLRSSHGIRSAILVNELLAPPLYRRKRKNA